MIRCKIADTSTCGKVICCCQCDEKDECISTCSFVYDDDHEGCENKEETSEEIINLDKTHHNIIQTITDLMLQKEHIDSQMESLKEALLKAMEENDVKKFENEHVVFTYVAPTTKSTIDSKTLKVDHPDIAEKYTKTSNVKASVRIKVK